MAKKEYHTLVIKIGSSTLTNPKGDLDLASLKHIVAEAAKLNRSGKKALIVTSGAIVTGAKKLGIGKPKTIPEKQAAAAVGQSILMRQYEKAFEKYKITTAQVLLTRDALENHERRQHAKDCISTLQAEGVIPIINENDAVAVEEIKIGDNDTLAAATAKLVGADLLILLTDVDGFFMKSKDGKNFLIEEIKEISPAIKAAAGRPETHLGTGGMLTKIQAAETCVSAGIDVLITNGKKKVSLSAALDRKKIGTYFLAP